MRRWLGIFSATIFAATVALPGWGMAAELWAGHQVMKGSRAVPILGNLETRTDSYYLATVERKEGQILLSQKTCKMEIARFAGVKVSFLPEGVMRMPPTEITYTLRGGRWEAGPWLTEWKDEDVDGDGNPGATVKVEAPICSGTLFVGGYSKARAKGTERESGIEGEVQAIVGHHILETSSGCIRLVAKDSEEKVSGTFAYTPVPADTTCESLLAAEWPAQAKETEEAKRPPPSQRPGRVR